MHSSLTATENCSTARRKTAKLLPLRSISEIWWATAKVCAKGVKPEVENNE
jgi:hypothetical protein